MHPHLDLDLVHGAQTSLTAAAEATGANKASKQPRNNSTGIESIRNPCREALLREAGPKESAPWAFLLFLFLKRRRRQRKAIAGPLRFLVLVLMAR